MSKASSLPSSDVMLYALVLVSWSYCRLLPSTLSTLSDGFSPPIHDACFAVRRCWDSILTFLASSLPLHSSTTGFFCEKGKASLHVG